VCILIYSHAYTYTYIHTQQRALGGPVAQMAALVTEDTMVKLLRMGRWGL
jgi:hypothetical protein